MELNWSNRVIKYVLLVFNFLFVITGIIMISVGVSVKTYYTKYDIFLSDKYFSLPNLLIAIGAIIFIISFFGCYGAMRENWFLIFIVRGTFSILLAIIFIMEFSAGIAGYVLRDQTSDYLTTELKSTIPDYVRDPSKANAVTRMWDVIQYEFECCGATGPKDWVIQPTTTVKPTEAPPANETSKPPSSTAAVTQSPPTTIPSTSNATTTLKPETTSASSTESNNSTTSLEPSSTPEIQNQTISDAVKPPIPGPSAGALRLLINGVARAEEPTAPALNAGDLPASCCKARPGATGTTVCNLNSTSTATYYKQGCVEGFGDYLKEHAVTLGGVGIAFAVIQLFGVIFSCHLARQIKNSFYST